MYNGSLANVGVGDWAGWALCDGSNGTPDLRDRFIIGAGNKVVGNKNNSVGLTTDVQGSHTHTISGTALALSQIPSHNHGSITGYMSHDHQHYISGYTDTHGGHQHPSGYAQTNVPDEGGWSYKAAGTDTSAYTGVAGAHYHAINFYSGYASQNHYHAIPAEGGGGSHAHTASTGGDHSHSASLTVLREAIPYYALAFVMKL